jgi:N-acyl-L-homoserine lactone synthetase
MKSRPSALAYANPFLLWGALGVKAIQMSTAAAQVIAIRTTRMAAHGLNPNASERREMTRMGAEKVDAFSRAGQALATGALPLVAGMASQAWRSGLDLLTASTQLAASRTLPQTLARQRKLAHTLMRSAPAAHHGAASKAMAQLAHRALAPVHQKATANARRLTKKAR